MSFFSPPDEAGRKFQVRSDVVYNIYIVWLFITNTTVYRCITAVYCIYYTYNTAVDTYIKVIYD